MNGPVIYCCVTAYPKSWWLKTAKLYRFPLFCGSGNWLGHSSAPFGVSVSHSLSCSQGAGGSSWAGRSRQTGHVSGASGVPPQGHPLSLRVADLGLLTAGGLG